MYVRRLAEHLLQVPELSIHLIAGRPVPQSPAEWWKAGWWRSQGNSTGVPLKLLYAAWNYLGVPKVRASLDLIHATGLVIPPVDSARLVATVHDLAVETMPEVVPSGWRRIYARGLKLALSRAAAICVVSEAVKAQLAELHSVEDERMVVTPEAANVTPNDYRDRGALERMGIGPHFVLTVGTLEPRKNHKVLIEAFAEAGPDLQSMQLVIAGASGWASSATLHTIERLRLQSRVILTGAVSSSALAALYASATIFALPSVYEGFGIPLVEAMGFGLPCIASGDPALKEAGGGAVTFLDAADTGAWAGELARLAGDEDSRKQMASAALSRAATFSWEKTAVKTLEAYRRAAA